MNSRQRAHPSHWGSSAAARDLALLVAAATRALQGDSGAGRKAVFLDVNPSAAHRAFRHLALQRRIDHEPDLFDGPQSKGGSARVLIAAQGDVSAAFGARGFESIVAAHHFRQADLQRGLVDWADSAVVPGVLEDLLALFGRPGHC